MKKGLIYNVGPLTNKYSGVHTYADVLFPFIKQLVRQGIDLTWAGITLDNRNFNANVSKYIGQYVDSDYENDVRGFLHSMEQSWDMIDVSKFDFLLCQPRPDCNEIENMILFKLIEKFIEADKTVFLWEQDLFLDRFSEELSKKIVLLHPSIIAPEKEFGSKHYFPFFTFDIPYTLEHIKVKTDFMFIGNIYFRENQALRFFKPMMESNLTKTIFGSWLRTEERREFSSQFKNFRFEGSCEHQFAIPLMSSAKSTLHILPDFAMTRGLMTARVFTSQIASTLCFCDSKIYGADQFFPKELLVENGQEMVEKFPYIIKYKESLLEKRVTLMQEHTVENRVKQFIDLLRIYT